MLFGSIVTGELASPRQAALPIFAAVGGMVVPATLFALFNAGGEGAAGWGIPMATNIAFALGVIALLGDRVPRSLAICLTALAIVDDLGAVLVIALFYTGDLYLVALASAIGLLVILAIGNPPRSQNAELLCPVRPVAVDRPAQNPEFTPPWPGY